MSLNDASSAAISASSLKQLMLKLVNLFSLERPQFLNNCEQSGYSRGCSVQIL